MTGWLKMYRQIMDNGLWKDKPYARGQAWMDILLNTSYESSSFWVRGIEVKVSPGQCAMSTHTMSNRWGWSRKKVTSFLKHLEKELQIEPQKTNVTTLITIVKWKEYQQKEPQIAPQENHKGTTEEPIKEGKEGKEENLDKYDAASEKTKADILSIFPRIEEAYDFEFIKWKNYRKARKPVIDLNANLMDWMKRAVGKIPKEPEQSSTTDNKRRMKEAEKAGLIL